MAGAFELLKQDHRTVEQLFDQFATSGDRDVALRICDELSIHATLEEEMVYPILRSKVSVSVADEARDEHTQASEIIARIYALESDDGQLKAEVEELRKVIDHHVREEENEVFPELEATIPDTVELLGNELVERKKQLQAANERVSGSVAEKPVPSGDPARDEQHG